MVNVPTNKMFLDCVNSFEKLEAPSKIIEKCSRAINTGLISVDEAIIHGLLMSLYAKQGDLEKSQHELLLARRAIGKVIDLKGEELERFVRKESENPAPFEALDDKVNWREELAKNAMLASLVLKPLVASPRDWEKGVTDEQKRETALSDCSDFPGIIVYLLLGDLWATQNVDYAIKCFKIVKDHEVEENPSNSPPTISQLVAGYKLAILYKNKGDKYSARKEFEEVLSALSHPNWHNLPENEKEIEEYWISKAKDEITKMGQQSKRGFFSLLRRS
jgi:hypothetical protein